MKMAYSEHIGNENNKHKESFDSPCPKISICVCIYNAEKYLSQCCESLFEQSYGNIEYIFIDDCSSDQSLSILYRIINRYPIRKNNTHIIKHNYNMGVSVSRQECILASTGEYMIYCDADDWPENTMYEELISKAITTNADIVGCDYFSHDQLNGVNELHKQLFNLDKEQIIKEIIGG